MSEITETKIKSMTKEQNYMCGYRDGKSDVLNKLRAEIEQIEINGHIRDVECFNAGLNTAVKIIDKYTVESESKEIEEECIGDYTYDKVAKIHCIEILNKHTSRKEDV